MNKKKPTKVGSSPDPGNDRTGSTQRSLDQQSMLVDVPCWSNLVELILILFYCYYSGSLLVLLLSQAEIPDIPNTTQRV